MNYTPYANHTDDELIREVCNKEEATQLELELMERLDYWIEYARTLEESAGVEHPFIPETKYLEAA